MAVPGSKERCHSSDRDRSDRDRLDGDDDDNQRRKIRPARMHQIALFNGLSEERWEQSPLSRTIGVQERIFCRRRRRATRTEVLHHHHMFFLVLAALLVTQTVKGQSAAGGGLFEESFNNLENNFTYDDDDALNVSNLLEQEERKYQLEYEMEIPLEHLEPWMLSSWDIAMETTTTTTTTTNWTSTADPNFEYVKVQFENHMEVDVTKAIGKEFFPSLVDYIQNIPTTCKVFTWHVVVISTGRNVSTTTTSPAASLQVQVDYSMLYEAPVVNLTSSLHEKYLFLFEISRGSYKKELATELIKWYNLSDTSTNSTVTSVDVFKNETVAPTTTAAAHYHTCSPTFAPSHSASGGGTRLPPPTCSPTTSPTVSSILYRGSGFYDLEIITYNIDEPVDFFTGNTVPLCTALEVLSDDMSRSTLFNHFPAWIFKNCTVSDIREKVPLLTLFNQIRQRRQQQLQLIPVEFDDDEETEEGDVTISNDEDIGDTDEHYELDSLDPESTEDDSRPRRLRLGVKEDDDNHRDLQLLPFSNNTTDTSNGNSTPTKVKFEIQMRWTSSFHQNVTEYGDYFLGWVLENTQKLEHLLNQFYMFQEPERVGYHSFDNTYLPKPTPRPTPSPTIFATTSSSPTDSSTNDTIVSAEPSSAPTAQPTKKEKPPDSNPSNNVVIIVGIVIAIIVFVVAVGWIWFHLKQLQRKLDTAMNDQNNSPLMQNESPPTTNNNVPAANSTVLPTTTTTVGFAAGQTTTTQEFSNDAVLGGRPNTNNAGGVISTGGPPTGGSSPGAAAIQVIPVPSSLQSTTTSPATADDSRIQRATSASTGIFTSSTSSQGFADMPVMMVHDLSANHHVDEAAAVEDHRQAFLSFLPDSTDGGGYHQQGGAAGTDEFEQYKDPNLEKMRRSIEGNVTGMGGMMSQAMTKALMDSDSPQDVFPAGMSGAELEVNALWEVSEWLRRQNEEASDYQKGEYMQELLNKMVTFVRAGIVTPEDGSRSIHGCAALLGLQLANQLPSTTLILSGMLKTTTADDVRRKFVDFGPVEDVAVAAGEKGFGLVHFKSPKSVERALDAFRGSEVVVNNVAIQLAKLS